MQLSKRNQMDENMFFSQLMELVKEENDSKTELFLKKYLTWADEKKKYEILEIEKCYLVSSHVCRRSFATNFYGNKMFTTPQLMAISGHKTETMFLQYIGKTKDDWAMQTAKTFKELSCKTIYARTLVVFHAF